MDSFIIARILFAATITFHILFPTINIALAWVLLYLKTKYILTNDKGWFDAYKFWVKIFALSFALGAVSGIAMSFQFGTNWPGFMQTVGNVAGPLLGYEVLTAFFLEATFLGIMLFGMNRVSKWVHLFSVFAVAVGVTMSAFWILTLNSWMQNPQGIQMINGVAHVISWREVIFNPTMPYTLIHMLLACFLTVAFLLAGISAYQLIKVPNAIFPWKTLRLGIVMAVILAPTQIIFGDLVGLNTKKYQPAKVAAIEANWETRNSVPLVLFAWPDEKARENRFSLEIPYLTSLILTHSFTGEVQGLNDFKGEHPPVKPVFFAFRVMVGVGILMLLVSAWCFYRLMRSHIGKIEKYVLVAMAFSGWVATIAGWYVTEIGRQPYLVYKILKTKDAVSNVPKEYLASILSSVLTLYTFLFFGFIFLVFWLAKRSARNGVKYVK